MPIIVTGSIAIDRLMHFRGQFADQLLPDRLHDLSLSFLIDDLQVRGGGASANIAFAAAALGCTPLLIGAVGRDFGEYRTELENSGVDCSQLRVSAEKNTAQSISITDDESCQISSFFPGAMTEAAQIELPEVVEQVGTVELVLISPDDPAAMVKHAASCRDHGYPFAVDPSQQLASMDRTQIRDFVTGARYLFSNDYEWKLLLRKTEWSEVEVLSRVDMRVTTLGDKGLQIAKADAETINIGPVPPLASGNPTGAGDAFRGGFLAGLAAGLTLTRSAQLGALTGVLAFETTGPRDWTLEPTTALHRLGEAFGADAANEISAAVPRRLTGSAR